MEKEKQLDKISYTFSNETADWGLPVIIFKEDNTAIYYCPALDLSGYGHDEMEAGESFKVVLEEYLLYTTNHKTLLTDLKKLGWKVRKNEKEIIPPKLSTSLKENKFTIMNTDIASLLPADFHPSSRVWIYQSNRPLDETEVNHINDRLQLFAENWQSHGQAVKGWAKVLFNRFVILMAEESLAGVSGCSTDSSVRLIKELETQYSLDLFNRTNLAFLINDQLNLIPLNQLSNSINEGKVNPQTLFFNNMAETKEQLINNWLVPVDKSWLQQKFRPQLAAQ